MQQSQPQKVPQFKPTSCLRWLLQRLTLLSAYWQKTMPNIHMDNVVCKTSQSLAWQVGDSCQKWETRSKLTLQILNVEATHHVDCGGSALVRRVVPRGSCSKTCSCPTSRQCITAQFSLSENNGDGAAVEDSLIKAKCSFTQCGRR